MVSLRPEPDSRRPATVAELMRRHFISLAPKDSLLAAFQLMRLARLRVLPVVREGVLIGVLTYRDLNQALLRELLGSPAPALEAIPVESVMDAPTVTLAPEARARGARARPPRRGAAGGRRRGPVPGLAGLPARGRAGAARATASRPGDRVGPPAGGLRPGRPTRLAGPSAGRAPSAPDAGPRCGRTGQPRRHARHRDAGRWHAACVGSGRERPNEIPRR